MKLEKEKKEKGKSGDKKISYENTNEKEEKKIEENFGRMRKKRKILPDYFENIKDDKKVEENSKIIKQLEDNHEKEIIDEDNILRSSVINFTIKKKKELLQEYIKKQENIENITLPKKNGY